MVPSPGPPLTTLTITQGSSAPAMYEIPSWKRDIPGLEEEVITLRPAEAAPNTMFIAASSLSAWRTTMPVRSSGFSSIRYSSTSDCGVIG